MYTQEAFTHFGILAEPGTSGPDLGRYVLVCFTILALTAAAAFFARRYLAGALRKRASQRSLRIVDVLPLGGRRQVCVVRVYDRTFALGVGEKELALIAELNSVIGEAPERPVQATPQDERDFQRLLREARARLERSVLEPRPAAGAPAAQPAAAPRKESTL